MRGMAWTVIDVGLAKKRVAQRLGRCPDCAPAHPITHLWKSGLPTAGVGVQSRRPPAPYREPCLNRMTKNTDIWNAPVR